MARTTIYKLKRIHTMREAKLKGESWYTNPHNHPEPTLPSEEHLRQSYLSELSRSAPDLLPNAIELIQYALSGKERRG